MSRRSRSRTSSPAGAGPVLAASEVPGSGTPEKRRRSSRTPSPAREAKRSRPASPAQGANGAAASSEVITAATYLLGAMSTSLDSLEFVFDQNATKAAPPSKRKRKTLKSQVEKDVASGSVSNLTDRFYSFQELSRTLQGVVIGKEGLVWKTDITSDDALKKATQAELYGLFSQPLVRIIAQDHEAIHSSELALETAVRKQKAAEKARDEKIREAREKATQLKEEQKRTRDLKRANDTMSVRTGMTAGSAATFRSVNPAAMARLQQYKIPDQAPLDNDPCQLFKSTASPVCFFVVDRALKLLGTTSCPVLVQTFINDAMRNQYSEDKPVFEAVNRLTNTVDDHVLEEAGLNGLIEELHDHFKPEQDVPKAKNELYFYQVARGLYGGTGRGGFKKPYMDRDEGERQIYAGKEEYFCKCRDNNIDRREFGLGLGAR